jgi:1-pyrroline-5-carboxylate dehydrogenase
MAGVDGIFTPPVPANEPVKPYIPGSPDVASLKQVLSGMEGEVTEIGNVINGDIVETGETWNLTMPCDHAHVLGRVHMTPPELVEQAIDGALAAKSDWAALPWQDRAAVFLKAADLLKGPWRDVINASTMLGQAKTVHQAEIDASCELIDFWKFNVTYQAQIMADQPPVSGPGTWNRSDHRPLDGFVFAVTPFNFTSIAANLPTAPALMGNTVIWKPSPTQAHSAWFLMDLLREAGLPDGVIQMVHGAGPDVGDVVLPHRDLGGIHFTGSTPTFQTMWRTVGENITNYRQYPRIVGETGGKDFVVAHPSADARALAVALLRGAFEYQGQKCSAASRAYIPSNLWPAVSEQLRSMMGEITQGDVRDFSNYVGAVIDNRAFTKHCGYLELAATTATVIAGGKAHGDTGWFVEPTVVQVDDPRHRLMVEEIFGPILTVYVYPESEWDQTLEIVDQTSVYALTGAVFSQDRQAIVQATAALRHAAGNFYINDKPTGAVVGQQPFGGSRASGTNDKAGSPLNLLRWVSPRSIKETFVPAQDWRYPFLG